MGRRAAIERGCRFEQETSDGVRAAQYGTLYACRGSRLYSTTLCKCDLLLGGQRQKEAVACLLVFSASSGVAEAKCNDDHQKAMAMTGL